MAVHVKMMDMDISVFAVAGFLVLASFLLLILRHQRGCASAPKRPPMVNSNPIFGVPDKGNPRDNFVSRRRKYGNVFAAKEKSGMTGVYVGDALALKDIAENIDVFDVGPVHLSAANMFTISDKVGYWMAFQGGGAASIQLSYKLFSGSKLVSLQQRFVEAATKGLTRISTDLSLTTKNNDDKSGKRVDLFRLTSETFYESTLEALFSCHFPKGTYDDFHIWDSNLIEFCNGYPSPASVGARDRIAKVFEQHIDEHLSECSVQVREQMEVFEQRYGHSHRDAIGLVLRNSWLAAVQAPLSGAWLCCILSHRPAQLRLIRTELELLRQKLGDDVSLEQIASNPEYLKAENLPTLDHFVQEVLRVWAAQNVPRVCQRDTVVRTMDRNGKVRPMLFKKGDVIQLVWWNVHSSEAYPKWWDNAAPNSTVYDGALEPFDETRFESSLATISIQHGNEKVRTFVPFGYGPRICPGRFWAVTEMKAFCILFFNRFDVSDPQTMPSPNIDMWAGSLHAANPMRVNLLHKQS